VIKLINQRGDTLVEVTMALAILALVLTGAFGLANKAFRIGQDAKERSQMVSDAQQQAEALQNFRDSHTWHDFVLGNASTGLPGIVTRNGSGDCDTAAVGLQTCFHMVQQTVSGLTQWVPQVGPGTDTQIGGQGYVRITVTPDPSPATIQPNYSFQIQYGIPPRGGGVTLASNLRLYLTNLDGLRR
jgi:prepilin-type N-terminal cleavage/methylation domain-containing protein